MRLSLKNLAARCLKEASGAAAVEYGLIAAGISVAIVTVVQSLGARLNETFTAVQAGLK